MLHPRKRFYAGGAQSVRGFGENQLGPRILTIDPATLLASGCAVEPETAPACDINGSALNDDDFRVRPLGGTQLAEASVEVRARLWRALVGAVFVDGAILTDGISPLGSTRIMAMTPGLGVRYESPVGPIRMDLGIRPALREAIPVITEIRRDNGERTLVPLAEAGACRDATAVGTGCRTFPDPLGQRAWLRRVTDRLTLHLSIGEAY